MDEKPSRKLKKNLPPIELTYKQVEFSGPSISALDRAFDILFDEVLRRREVNTKTYPQKDIDS